MTSGMISLPRLTCQDRRVTGVIPSLGRRSTGRAPDASRASLVADSAAGLAVPAVLQLDDPVAGNGAGDQVEPVGLGDAVEQPGTLAGNVREQAQLELVDQVEPHERPPEADAAPDHDVAVAAQPE